MLTTGLLIQIAGSDIIKRSLLACTRKESDSDHTLILVVNAPRAVMAFLISEKI